MIEFKKGDCVQLKSGSAKMTIEEIPVENAFYDPNSIYAACVWVESGINMRENFDVALLLGCGPQKA